MYRRCVGPHAVSIVRGPASHIERGKRKKALVSTDQRLLIATVPGGMGMPGGRALQEGVGE